MLYSTGMGKKSSGGEGMECQQPFSPKKGVLSIKGPIFSYFFNINLCMNSPVTPILSKLYMYTCMRYVYSKFIEEIKIIFSRQYFYSSSLE